MGIFTVILLYRGFGLHLQIRASPKNKFLLRGVHFNPHAKCLSSKFNLKLFKKTFMIRDFGSPAMYLHGGLKVRQDIANSVDTNKNKSMSTLFFSVM